MPLASIVRSLPLSMIESLGVKSEPFFANLKFKSELLMRAMFEAEDRGCSYFSVAFNPDSAVEISRGLINLHFSPRKKSSD
jgi:hypothetical protein